MVWFGIVRLSCVNCVADRRKERIARSDVYASPEDGGACVSVYGAEKRGVER